MKAILQMLNVAQKLNVDFLFLKVNVKRKKNADK